MEKEEIIGCILQIVAGPVFVFSAYAGLDLGHVALSLLGMLATLAMLTVGDYLGAPLLRKLGIFTSWKYK